MAQEKGSRAELESIIARTALKYDLLPYESNPFPQSHPARMGALARLFGLNAAPLEKARVLELGCAAGGNIIPHAQRNPEATFVGVDLSRTQVAAGRSRIEALGLKNIEIHCQSFTELSEQAGEFDYIICHGVYSWVPAPVREAILRISRERLAPEGIAYVSYNVLPGWRTLQTLRDAFLLEIPDSHDSRQRVAQARQMLEFLKSTMPSQSPYQQIVAGAAPRLAGLPDDYLAHEFLEEINDPCTFKDFLTAANKQGLAYMGDTELPSMILENQPAETAKKVRERAGNNLAATEQYLDLITGRTFRQTLLVHNAAQSKIDRNLVSQKLEAMNFITSPELKFERQGQGCTVTDNAGRRLTTTAPAVADAMEHLVTRFPASFTLDSLSGVLGAANRTPEARNLIRDALFNMILVGLATVSLSPVPAAAVSAKPLACPMARSDAKRGERSTANLRHERILFDPAARAALPFMDGNHDHAQLAGVLAEEALAGRLNFNKDGKPVTDKAAIEALSKEHIKAVIAGCARAALLEG